MKTLIKKTLKKLGYELHKLPAIENEKGTRFRTALTMPDALCRCKDRGINVNTIIDIGASDGRWSLECAEFFPEAQYLLIEAQSQHENALKSLASHRQNFHYVIAAAGDKEGKIYFENDSPFGGSAHQMATQSAIETPMICIDNELKKRNLKPPFLLKLDTHGFEVPILEGAADTLKKSALVIIETYNYRLTETSLKYHEMCQYLEQRGFSSIEMVDLMLRQYDASFWQMDIFFVPSNSKEFTYNKYKS